MAGFLGRAARQSARIVSVTARAAAARSTDHVARSTQIDADWRRIEQGRAARLGADQTIDVARRIGRWRTVDPRTPRPVTGVGAKLLSVTVWTTAVGAAWWVGTRHRRGPLASVADLDQFGSAIMRPWATAGDDLA